MVSCCAITLIGAGCTVALRDPGVTAGCGPLRYRVNAHDVELASAQVTAIDTAVVEYAELVGRVVERAAPSDATARDNEPGDPIVFDVSWPSENPAGLGYSEPHVVGSSYAGGWVMLNPTIRNAPPGVIRRLVLHELGHLHGLADVDDTDELMDPSLAATEWGAGDLVGLFLTHDGGCSGSPLAAELQTAIG